MRPDVLLAQLALCASSAHAFFPYDPDWRRDVGHKRAARGQRSLDGQTGQGVRMDIRQRTPQTSRPVSERAAHEAARLIAKYTGRDLPSDSELAKRDNDIAYGSGKVSGTLARDTISLAGMSFKYQFGLATTTSDQFIQFAFDGILGLAMNEGANENFLSTLEKTGELDNNVFCIALNRASDGTNEGEISFGSPNTDKYSGKISYTSLGEKDDWAIEMDDMGYNGENAGVGGIRSFIDTGTSFIFGASDNVKKLHSLIPGAESSDDTTYKVPCDSNGNLTVTFSGVDYVISSKDWVSPPNKAGECTSNIYGYEVVKGAWLLGDTFIKNVYAVFDPDERRIGFATSAISGGSADDDDDDDDKSSSTKTGSSHVASKTSDEADESDETGVSALPDTTETSQPDIGLGKESVSTGTATADASEASETKDSAAPAGPLSQACYTFIFCIVPFFALLA
ncbi:hypothetical protein ACJZ2D_016813 [Fusarium nematophilum]